MWFAAATPEPKVSLDMASHWPDELRIEFAASVVPHFRKFDFQEGAPYPVTDPDEYTRERPVAMRIAGAGIPGNVIMYLRLVYQKSDSGTEICAYEMRDQYKQMASCVFAQKPERCDPGRIIPRGCGRGLYRRRAGPPPNDGHG